MKTIITCICITLLLAISLPSGASDLAELYPEKIAKAKNIYPLAEKFFKGPKALAAGESLTPERLKNPERQQAHYQFNRIIGLAIDAGIDLSHLREFGITKENNQYKLDLTNNPDWMSNRTLFTFFTNPEQLQRNSQMLKSMGLSKQDIHALDSYLHSNDPYKLADIAERDYLQAQAKRLAKKPNAQSTSLHEIVAIHEQSNLVRDKSWNKWATELLNSLSSYKQRILVQYLMQGKSRMVIIPAPINKNYLVSYKKQLMSGEVVDNLTKSINKTQEQ